MKILAVTVISLAFLCLLPFSLGKVDRYQMPIVEEGTPFLEQIEVDEEQDVEVFRVPAHNNVNAAEFYHDFKMRVTVTKDLSLKVCYIANIDPSVPSPKKLKADTARAASQLGKLPITTKEHLVLLTGPADKSSLKKEILEFCGALPIYETEVFKDPVKGEDGTFSVKPTRRQRRQISVHLSNYTSCMKSVNHQENLLKHVKEGKCNEQPWAWIFRCSLKRLNRSCYYYIYCRRSPVKPPPGKDSIFHCDKVHSTGNADFGFCCDFVCPPN